MTTSKTSEGASAPFDASTALGQIATSTIDVTTPKRKFKSRFFFVLEEDLEVRKEKFKPKKLVHVDAEIVTRAAAYKKEVSPELQSKIEEIREFFLKEIAPLTMAASGGVVQAHKVVERYVDGKIDQTLIRVFDEMVARAAKLKLAAFVTDLFGLSDKQTEELFAKPQPAPDKTGQKLTETLDRIVSQLEAQDKNMNILTGQMKKLRRNE